MGGKLSRELGSPSRQILSECLSEKKVLTPLPDTYANNRALSRPLIISPSLTELSSNWAIKKRVYMKKSWPAWRVTISSRNGSPARRVNILIEQPF